MVAGGRRRYGARRTASVLPELDARHDWCWLQTGGGVRRLVSRERRRAEEHECPVALNCAWDQLPGARTRTSVSFLVIVCQSSCLVIS